MHDQMNGASLTPKKAESFESQPNPKASPKPLPSSNAETASFNERPFAANRGGDNSQGGDITPSRAR